MGTPIGIIVHFERRLSPSVRAGARACALRAKKESGRADRTKADAGRGVIVWDACMHTDCEERGARRGVGVDDVNAGVEKVIMMTGLKSGDGDVDK